MLRGASTILMVVAVLAVVGFMWWLDRKAGSLDTEVAPVLEEVTESVPVDLNSAVFASDPASVVDQPCTRQLQRFEWSHAVAFAGGKVPVSVGAEEAS